MVAVHQEVEAGEGEAAVMVGQEVAAVGAAAVAATVATGEQSS